MIDFAHRSDKVFVFGEAMIELSGIVGTSARIGVAGDTFNTAVYLARSGLNASYVTALGDDPFSARIVEALRDENIDTRAVLSVKGGAPGLYAIELDEKGERSFTYWRSASAVKRFFNAPGVDEIIAEMSSADALYLSGITLSVFDQSGRDKITNIVKAVHRSGGLVIFDTNYRAAGWRCKSEAAEAVVALMPYISIALPTWEDEYELFGDVDPEACAARWHKCGTSEVVVKAGPRGAYSKDTGWLAPAASIDPVDTTGAGDSFNGTYIAARLSGGGMEMAISKGHELAAKVLLSYGAIIAREEEPQICV